MVFFVFFVFIFFFAFSFRWCGLAPSALEWMSERLFCARDLGSVVVPPYLSTVLH